MHVTQLTTRAHALIADNCRYETPCIRSYGVGEPIKKVSQKSAEYIVVKKFVKSQNFGRFPIFCPICSNIISGWFQSVKLFFVVHLHHMNKHKEFHTYRLKLIGNNIRGSWTKTGKSSKNLSFTDFHDLFYVEICGGFLCNLFS